MHHIKTAIISFFIAINLISCSSMPSNKISVINGHCEPIIMPLELKEIKNFNDSLKNQEMFILYYENLKTEATRCNECWKETLLKINR